MFAALLAASTLAGCANSGGTESDPLFEWMDPQHTGIQFVNHLEEDDELNVVSFEAFFNGSGVGTGDVNGDGRPDVIFTSNRGDNRLYLNDGDWRFRDDTDKAGLLSRGKWANGVALVDINHDGHLDIYISYGGPFADPEMRANELYVNHGDGTFTERAAEYGLDDTGVTIQAAFFDYDRDGDLDAYLLTNGADDRPPNVVAPRKTRGESATTDRLYRNNGDGTFTDVSEEAGILTEGYGLGILVLDVNQDGWPDVYAANDYLSNDLLYVNQGDGTFMNRIADAFRHQSFAAMGADAADINNDGLLDIMTADMLAPTNEGIKRMYGDAGYSRRRSEVLAGYERQVTRNTLQLNTGPTPGSDLPAFSEIGLLAGVSSTNWSWSVLFADYDLDGRRDVLVTNGIPRDITNLDFAEAKMQQLRLRGGDPQIIPRLAEQLRSIDGIHVENVFFRNEGDLTFENVSREWGIDRPSYTTGAAYADFDGDGDLDLVLANQNETAFVYRNRARERGAGNYLRLEFDGPEMNPAGLGARVLAHYSGQAVLHEHSPYRGYLSSVDGGIHFGLGSASRVDSIVVTWPDGRTETIEEVAANQAITVDYRRAVESPESTRPSSSSPGGAEVFFADVTRDREIDYKHADQHYNDFELQPLLPHKFSQSGPPLAVGDVNGDGLDDFFVGGAFAQRGRIYLQNSDGTFDYDEFSEGLATRRSGDRNFEEDAGALFFDANGDGALDLYVASGGSEFAAGSPYYQDRLYLGDGRGGFAEAPDLLPDLTTSTSAVEAADFDGDGDLDLFVGGRVVPNRYPEAPRSYLLENRDGAFVDVTRSVAPQLYTVGLVSSAEWVDFTGDDVVDLVVAGEWMPLTFFENSGGRLTDVTHAVGMSSTVGWWNDIVSGDFDGDGDIDFVAGNLGLNTNLRNQPEGNVRMHVKDVNRDGRLDPVLSRFIGRRSYPLALRDDLLDQMAHLLPRIPTNADYAVMTTEDLFTKEEMTGMTVLQSDRFETSYIENVGGSQFETRSLPIQAQFAPVNGIVTGDFDHDGHLDVAMVGNSHANEAFVGPYDAFSGLILLGDGTGGFTAATHQRSGFYVAGDARALASLTGAAGETLLLSAQNDSYLRLFSATRPASASALSQERDEETAAALAPDRPAPSRSE